MNKTANNSGVFITVEGIEGVGKSTNMQFIEHWLCSRGFDVVRTREPGGTPVAESIRSILLNQHEEHLEDATELLLITAARLQHYTQLIAPALRAGKVVLSDRFSDSTYAYQGGGRGMSTEIMQSLEQQFLRMATPDMTFLLDADPEIGLSRAEKRSAKDRFEQESLMFFQRVRQAFLDRAELQPERFQIIDASAELSAVQQSIATGLSDWFKAH